MRDNNGAENSLRRGWTRYLEPHRKKRAPSPAAPTARPAPVVRAAPAAQAAPAARSAAGNRSTPSPAASADSYSRRRGPSALKSIFVVAGMITAFIMIVYVGSHFSKTRPAGDGGTERNRAETPTREDFLALCRNADNPENFEAIQRVDPALAAALANSDPRLVLHSLVSSEDIASDAIGAILESPFGAQVNLADPSGDTPLHLAVRAGAEPAVLLLLRAAGADPLLRDADGKTPLELLLEGDPARFDERDVAIAAAYVDRRYILARRAAYPGEPPKIEQYDSLARHVTDPEQLRYFQVLASARTALAGTRLNQAVIDDSEMPGDISLPFIVAAESDLWTKARPAPGTAGLAARIKCLLPEARPESITWFSASAAGDNKAALPLQAEWDAWTAPERIRMLSEAIALGRLSGDTSSGSGLWESSAETVRREMADYAPSLRNTPLMIYCILTVEPRESLSQAAKQARKDKREHEAVLYELWGKLSPEARRRVGPHLVAATAYRVVSGSRLSLLPPHRLLGEHEDHLKPLRLWGAAEVETPEPAQKNVFATDFVHPEDKAYLLGRERRLKVPVVAKDSGEPLVAATSVCMELPEKDALKMFDLLIKAGNKPGTPDRNGRTPLAVARALKAPKAILNVLTP